MQPSDLVQIVTIVVGAIVSIATLYQQFRMRQLERELDKLRATVASVHALLLKDG